MAASATQDPPSKRASKSAKRNKNKSEETEVSTTVSTAPETDTPNGAVESYNGDGSYESPYLKDLYKNIRNVNKKIANASKVDNILAENQGKSLDELIFSRKINPDQKAQILKMPALKASLSQLEEQVAQFQKFDEEYKTKMQTDKVELEQSFRERLNKEVEEKVSAARDEARIQAQEIHQMNLLVVSRFLQLAAVRRLDEEVDKTLDENLAVEGVLARLFTADQRAVAAMLKLGEGTDETTFSLTGDPLSTTYAQLKAATSELPELDYPLIDVEKASGADATELPVQSGPTDADAGLAEFDAPTNIAMTNGHEEQSDKPYVPDEVFARGADAAAAAAGMKIHNGFNRYGTTNMLYPAKTNANNGLAATDEAATDVDPIGAAPPNIQSWADDQPEPLSEQTSATPSTTNDGFHEVHRSRGGRTRGDGQNRGRGRGRGGDNHRGRNGGFRGEGRGEGRGRGRGGQRGSANRGARRSDES